jgi:hypothetical protein
MERILSPPMPVSLTEPPRMPDFWEPRTSPGIPVTWPPQEGHPELDYYISAAGRNPSKLMDGEWYTGPWGRIHANFKARRFEFVPLGLPERLGTQGVRPLREDEVRIFRDSGVQMDLAKALADGSVPQNLAARIRDYYLLWRHTHGVARLIRPLHEEFFRWLESPA